MSGERERRLAALGRAFRERLRADREMLRRLSPDGPLPDASRRDELLACVHRLGGSAGIFGAPRISAAAERLEEHLRRGGEAPGTALAELRAELDRELDGAALALTEWSAPLAVDTIRSGGVFDRGLGVAVFELCKTGDTRTRGGDLVMPPWISFHRTRPPFGSASGTAASTGSGARTSASSCGRSSLSTGWISP